MKLFQYWDTGDSPDDVAACIESFRVMNPDMQHRLFSRDDAAWFIKKHFGQRELKAFEACAVPAMQADYFRLCAVWARAGLWVDADFRCARPLVQLARQAPGGYLSMLENLLQNFVIFAPSPENHFVGACLELASRHVERRSDGDASDVTGPKVLNLVWTAVDPEGADADHHCARDRSFKTSREAIEAAAQFPGAAEAMARITRRHDIWTNKWLANTWLRYKATPLDWRRWEGSIYNPSEPGAFRSSASRADREAEVPL